MKYLIYFVIIVSLFCGCEVKYTKNQNARIFSKGDSIIIKHLNIEGTISGNYGFNTDHEYYVIYKDNKGIINTIILSQFLLEKNEK